MDVDDLRAAAAMWNAYDQILQALTALAETPEEIAQIQATARSRLDQFVTAAAKGG